MAERAPITAVVISGCLRQRFLALEKVPEATGGERSSAQGQGNSISHERIDKTGRVAHAQDVVLRRYGVVEQQWRCDHNIGEPLPGSTSLVQLQVLVESFIKRSGDIAANHGAYVDATVLAHRLYSAVTAFEKVEIHRVGGIFFSEMRFNAQPFNRTISIFSAVQVRPAAGSVDNTATPELLSGSSCYKGSIAFNRGDGFTFAGVYAGLPSRAPQGSVKLEASNACGWGVNWHGQNAVINEHSCSPDARAASQEISVSGKQRAEQYKRFRRHELATNFVSGEAGFVQQENTCAILRCGDGGRASPRSSADYCHVIQATVSQCFHAMTPMRNR